MGETAHDLLLRQFLDWLGAAGRSHSETMEAWRSSCPRLSVWEDALEAGLVRLEAGGAHVALTARGRAAVDATPATHRKKAPGISTGGK